MGLKRTAEFRLSDVSAYGPKQGCLLRESL